MVDFEIRRKIIQFASTFFYNRDFTNFFNGKIYAGKEKYLCSPALNCYSCPAATLSCPIGALQTVGGAAGFNISFYVLGFLLMIGVLVGRFICGFLCPFGLFQELLFKIPFPKLKLLRIFSYVKYFILAFFVMIIPLIGAINNGVGESAFCQYICPAGTLESAIPLLMTHSEFRDALGWLFALKLSVLVLVIIGSIVIYRMFCRILCPLGAIYGLFNKISVYHMNYDKNRCVSCKNCQNICPMDINPIVQGNSAECIRCGKCVNVCMENALYLGR